MRCSKTVAWLFYVTPIEDEGHTWLYWKNEMHCQGNDFMR